MNRPAGDPRREEPLVGAGRAPASTARRCFMTTDARARAGRKAAVLGPIPRDQIVTHTGERFEKYGCVLYTAVALSALLGPDDTIVPVSHVRRQDEGPIREILGAYPNIDTSGITSPGRPGGRHRAALHLAQPPRGVAGELHEPDPARRRG